MLDENQSNQNNQPTSDDYPSANAHLLQSAEEKKTWKYEDRELGVYVANGEAHAATVILDRETKKETGAFIVHQFSWNKNTAFINRESAFVTKLRRVGRSTEQDVDTTYAAKVNAELYRAVIAGAVLNVPKGNGEFDQVEKSRDEMLEFARLFPEAASEAIETWLESVKFKLLDSNSGSFDWMFEAGSVVKILCYIGDESDPQEAAVLTFKSPPTEAREKFDEEVQKIKSKKEGELNIATLSESVVKKIQYGAEHLLSVEGVEIGAQGLTYAELAASGEAKDKAKQKETFITLFNPITFVTAVETMHDSFDFLKGMSANG